MQPGLMQRASVLHKPASVITEVSDKDLASVQALTKETLKSDVRVEVLSVHKCLVLEYGKKNKEHYYERFVVVIKIPGRLLLVKQSYIGKSVVDNILILTLNEIKYYAHEHAGTDYHCVELHFNEDTKSVILCLPEAALQDLNHLLIKMLSVVHAVSQCAIFQPKLEAISKAEVLNRIDRRAFLLSDVDILSMSYQMFCIVECLPIDSGLIHLFIDKEFHEIHHVFDTYFVLKNYSTAARGNKHWKVNTREVMVILRALSFVKSFTHLHLDNIAVTEEVAVRLSKMLARNTHIISVAMRRTQMNAMIFNRLNQVLDQHIVANNLTLRVLDHLTLSHNNLQLVGTEDLKKKHRQRAEEGTAISFFGAMDGELLAVRKLYVSRCNLNRALISQIVDSVINYEYLEKLDLSFNNFANDSLITFKLSQMCKKVTILQSLLLKECRLQLTFLQDILSSSCYNYRQYLQFLDLSGNVMTHYAALAIGALLQNTLAPMIKIDLSDIADMDHEMLQSILFGPFRAPFKNIFVHLILSNIALDDNERLKALSNTVRFAQQQKNDCNGIQSLDISRNNLFSKFDLICDNFLCNFYCLEAINLDYNFKLNKSKKGFYASHITALCAAITKLPKLTSVSLRGSMPDNLFLTSDDLAPLLQFIANADQKCHLEKLFLDGNRIRDEGCKLIAHSLRTNKRLKIISIEDNKTTFKAFQTIMDTIVECKDMDVIKLCDMPLASMLDDATFKSKVKKNRAKIEQCIALIQENRLKADEEFDRDSGDEEAEPDGLRTMDKAVGSNAQESTSTENQNENDDAPPSNSPKFTKANTKMANIDKLAFMLNSTQLPRLKPVKNTKQSSDGSDDEKVPAPPPPPTSSGARTPRQMTSPRRRPVASPVTEAKVVSTGVEAELNKVDNTNVNNAKSKRKPKTRKKVNLDLDAE